MIDPFLGYRMTREAGRLEDLVSPPYDKIPLSLLATLRARSPYNAVHLIRGERDSSDTAWYAEAAKHLQRWVAEGRLVREAEAAYYLIDQEFGLPDGREMHRTAVVGSLDLKQSDRVHHHERTHARAREDRLALLRATGTHSGQIFILRKGQAALHARDLPTRHVDTFSDPAGVTTKFGVIQDAAVVQGLRRLLSEAEYVIADGHHRFVTACNFHAEQPGADRVMVAVVDLEDPGLCMLPTHRLITGVEPSRLADAIDGLKGLEPLAEGAVLTHAVIEAGPGTVGLAVSGRGSFLWRTGGDERGDAECLDVAVLESGLLAPLLSGLQVEDHLSYHRDPAPALERVQRNDADLLAVLAPIEPALMTSIALAGGVMPQKSTDFHPKVPTGLVYLATPAAPGL